MNSVKTFMVSDFGHGLEDNRAKKHAKVGAHNMHQSDHCRVLSVVDNYVCVLEYEK
jgi:hypothetical protein